MKEKELGIEPQQIFICSFYYAVAGALSLGAKWPGHEADHSPPSSAEVKNAWSYTSTLQYTFMAWCSVKAQGQL
jgi:hypothetical protein